MITQIPVKCILFETFVFLLHTSVVGFLFDWQWWCFSRSNVNGVLSQKSDRATLRSEHN